MTTLHQNSLVTQQLKLRWTKNRSLNAVWANTLLTPISKLLLLSFSRHSPSKELMSHPLPLSLKTLCQETNSCSQTVSQHLKKLQEQGYLLIHILSHKKRTYQLTNKLFSDYEAQLISEGFSPTKAKQKRFEGGNSIDSLWTVQDISSSQKLFLIWLGSQLKNKESIFSPLTHEQEKISFEKSLSRHSLARITQALEEKEYLHIKRNKKRGKEYIFSESLFPITPQFFKKEFSPQNNSHIKKNKMKHENKLRNTLLKNSKTIDSSSENQTSPSSLTNTPSSSTLSLLSTKEKNILNWLEEEAFRLTEFVLNFNSQDRLISSSFIKEFSLSLIHKFGIKSMRAAQEICLKNKTVINHPQIFYDLCQNEHNKEKFFLEQERQEKEKMEQENQEKIRLQKEIEIEMKEAAPEEKISESKSETEDSENPYPPEDFRSVLYSMFKKHYKKGPPSHFIPFLERLTTCQLNRYIREYNHLSHDKFESYIGPWAKYGASGFFGPHR